MKDAGLSMIVGTFSTMGIDTVTASNEFVDVVGNSGSGNTLVSIVGGVVATVVVQILRAKFPKLFKPYNSKKGGKSGTGSI